MSAPPPASFGRLPEIDDAKLDSQQSAALAAVSQGRGRVPTPYRLWIQSPDLVLCMHPLGRFLTQSTCLSKAEAEIAVLSAARHWHAHYVFVAHAREARGAGLDDQIISDLAQGHAPSPQDPRQNQIAIMMQALCSALPVPQDLFEKTVSILGHRAIAELIALTGYFSAVGLAMKFYAVEPAA